MDKLKVLVVDDEPNIRDLLSASLRFAGHQVATAANGTDAIKMITETSPDIVLLDVMLPDISGFGVTKKIRGMGIETPILFLTARDDTEDKVAGLTVGGDDYVTKPFSLDEIMARVSAIMRRTGKDSSAGSVINVGELSINEDAHEVSVNEQFVDLSPTEYQLLRYLATNPNRVLTKAQILDHVWEYDFNGEMGIVESYVSYLRKKLDPLSSKPLIVTKRGVGYMFKGPKG
ncbi:MAG: response regulator transcription factor [Micrococcales bacterium]|jgi:two-component system OmpR family response regulator|nr:response regulator transcription factor [Micrococcales bacterium]MBT5398085.1 response regulator transcription factor [Micrococcales bacterium]MBT5431024.1 response regulator transcription factor [Micrococcales bacterium]MBT5848020.1 response regulator transcription factor [Micrococcales bacterium]MBT7926512.1 response regulator transcription factor [Micrococcales bacterium]